MKTYKAYVYITIILSLIFVNIPVFAVSIYVPKDQPTIQAGIDAAEDGDTVFIDDGTYKGEGNVNIDFMGKQITVKSLNGADQTIINCLWTENTRGFIFQNKETNDTVLDGFTITNGVHDLGGGIYCINASPTIKNCVIVRNRVVRTERFTGRGGGIYAANSDIKIIDSTISNNTAEYYGAGVYFEGNDQLNEGERRSAINEPTLINCIVSDNRGGSGIISLQSVKTVIKDSEVSKNSGRGIVCTSFSRGGTHISNCLISQNTGGGVECSEFSIIVITDSIIRQNTAKEGGGIYGSPSANIEVTDCIISQNIATQTGGGIHVVSTFGRSKFTNCTITRNAANERGGGVYAFIEGAFFSMSDSIIWGNSSNRTHDEFSVIGGKIIIRSSDIRDGLDGIGREPGGWWFIYEDNIDVDPLFVDADRGDYSLKQNSPAAAMGASALKVGVTSVASIGKKLVMWGNLKRKSF